MKIEQQVCSLEWAKKLKALGVKQESLFYYMRPTEAGLYELITSQTEIDTYRDVINDTGIGSYVSALTVAELLAIAPASTSIQKRTDLETKKNARYYVEDFDHYRKEDYDENPANALAKFLVENKLITL